MARLPRSFIKQFEILGETGILEDGRLVLQPSVTVECQKCDYKHTISKIFVGKNYYCPQCGSTKNLYNAMEKEDLNLLSLLEGIGIPKPKVEIRETFNSAMMHLDGRTFDLKDDIPFDRRKMEEARGKDLGKFLRNISRKDAIKSYLEREGLDEESKDTLIEVLNERKLLKAARKYEADYKEVLKLRKPERKLWKEKEEERAEEQ